MMSRDFLRPDFIASAPGVMPALSCTTGVALRRDGNRRREPSVNRVASVNRERRGEGRMMEREIAWWRGEGTS